MLNAKCLALQEAVLGGSQSYVRFLVLETTYPMPRGLTSRAWDLEVLVDQSLVAPNTAAIPAVPACRMDHQKAKCWHHR